MIDVLISGSGASGLALGIDLARRGVSFRLLDKLESPFAGSRGKGVQPRTLEIFEDLGIVDRIAAAGGPYPAQRRYGADGNFQDEQNMALDQAVFSEPYRAPILIPQFRTEALMRERLAEFGIAPQYSREVLGFTQDADKVSVSVNGPDGIKTIDCRYFVGADGGRSFVRHALDLDFPGQTLGVRAMVADVTLTGLTGDVWHWFNDGDLQRQISFCPLPHSDVFQIQAPIAADGEMDLSTAGLQAFVDGRLPGSSIVIGTVVWASAYSMNARLTDRYRVGRVLLVGDAAHIHPPTGGQGLNTSVQDAYNLGWKLDAVLGGAPDALLDTYEAERHPIAAGMLGLATGLLEKAKTGHPRRGREVHQLDLSYEGSPLSLASATRDNGVAPGDRAPDAPLAGAANQPKRLFDLFKGTHWTLVGYEAEKPLCPPRAGLHIHTIGVDGDLRDLGGHFRDAYCLEPGEWVLVRPDGYIGAVLASSAIQTMEEYLKTVGMLA
jgi:2-polyprenyl-6-methoxyphenol hydroxylase-like FAD-dependent oxidoreductase